MILINGWRIERTKNTASHNRTVGDGEAAKGFAKAKKKEGPSPYLEPSLLRASRDEIIGDCMGIADKEGREKLTTLIKYYAHTLIFLLRDPHIGFLIIYTTLSVVAFFSTSKIFYCLHLYDIAVITVKATEQIRDAQQHNKGADSQHPAAGHDSLPATHYVLPVRPFRISLRRRYLLAACDRTCRRKRLLDFDPMFHNSGRIRTTLVGLFG